MVMPGNVNYFYRNGQLPAHTKNSFNEFGILTIHGIIACNAMILMHRLKYFPDTVPKSVRNLFPGDTPSFGTSASSDECNGWLDTYGGPTFRPSVFFKGPLLAISDTNKEILTNLSSLFSLNIYKRSVKQKIIEQQTSGDDESWPPFLIHNIKGMRHSTRLKCKMNESRP